MEVTLSTGLLSYTTPDGTTGYVNLTESTTIDVLEGHRYSAGTPTAQLMIINVPVVTPYFIVRVREADWRYLDIFCGTVTNQATWTNTLSGANTCASEVAGSIS